MSRRPGRSRRIAPFDRGAPAWSPSDIPGLVLWLDNSLITESAGKVTAWPDLSGLGNHAAQGNPALQPAYDATGLNGQPLVQFDTVDTVLDNATLSLPANTPFTVFAVGKSTNVNPDTTDRNGSWMQLGNPTGRHILSTSRVGGVHYISTITADVSISASYGIAQAPCALMWSDDGAGAAVMGFRANGVAKTASAGRPAAGAVSGYQLNTVRTTYFGAGIAAVLVYDSLLDAGEIALVESYIQTRWGVP